MLNAQPRARAPGVCRCLTALLIPAALSVSAAPVLLPAIPSPLATQSLLLDIAHAGDRIVAVGEQGHIVYSDDDGKSWAHAEVPVSHLLTSVTFASPQYGWAVGHDGIVLSSVDGGASWQVNITGLTIANLNTEAAIEHLAARQAALEAALDTHSSAGDADAAEVALDTHSSAGDADTAEQAVEDARFALEDARASQTDGITSPLLGVTFVSAVAGYAVGAYGALLSTHDSGKSWAQFSTRLDNPDNYHLYDLTQTVSGTLIVAGEAGTLFRSLDNGASWTRVDAGYDGSLFGVVALPDGSVVVFGLRGRIYRSEDDGQTWQASHSPGQSTLIAGKVLANDRVVLVGASGTVLESNDMGRSFSLIPVSVRSTFTGVTADATGHLLLTGFGGLTFIDTVSPGQDR